MKHILITTAFFITIVVAFLACKKEEVTPVPAKLEYVEAYIFKGEDDDCGYSLNINGASYAPNNLPVKYQHYTGVPDENTIFIQYKLLNVNDSLICYSNLFQPHQRVSTRKIEITKILE